jgi:hypothetical protein
MMDLIPVLVDGAIVLNLQNYCPSKSDCCDSCSQLILFTHNWLKTVELEYAVFDLLDEKYICPTFLDELLQLRKRLKFPFLFSGVMEQPRRHIERFNYQDYYPLFISPEDAIRALRIQHPGITESSNRGTINLGLSVLTSWKSYFDQSKPSAAEVYESRHAKVDYT